MGTAPPILITPRFLLPYSANAPVSDYRCVVNAAGTAVIVERTIFSPDGPLGPQLYRLDLTQEGAEPTFLLPGIDVSTRPDWSWVTGQIAFNYSRSVMVGVLDTAEAKPFAVRRDDGDNELSDVVPGREDACDRI